MTTEKAESENRESGNQPPQSRFHFSFSAFAILLLIVAAYWPALHGQFIWDDQLLVLKNPLVIGQLNLGNVWLQTDFSLTTVALWLQWLAWGNNPVGYHIVNVLLHVLSCVLLWRVLVRLKIPGAWLAAAIFAVHPVAAVSAGWISEMKNTQSLLFFLLSLRWFLKMDEASVSKSNSFASHSPAFSERQGNDRQRNSRPCFPAKAFYFLSLATFLLALLSKTSTVMLPVLLLLCAWWRDSGAGVPPVSLDQHSPPRVNSQAGHLCHYLVTLAPFFALSLLLGCATIWFQHRVIIAGDPVQTENFFGRFAATGMAIWFYLGKILLPINLSMIYPRWTVNQTSALSYVPPALWLGLLALLWKFRQRVEARASLFALGCFTIALFPVMGFLSMDYLVISRVSDHFQYLPMIAVITLLAAGLVRWLPTQILFPIATVLLLLLAFGTFQRTEIISHDETLWRDTLEKNPNSFTAHNNLGCFLAAKNKIDAAIPEFEETLRLRPQNAPAHANLGRAYAMRHDFAKANEHFEAALKLKSSDADIQGSYAAALAEQGRLPEAIPHLREAVRLEPRVEIRLHLASLLRGAGNSREAVEQYREALKREPDSVEALNNCAWLLATSPDAAVRNGADAVRFAEQACRLTQNKNPGMVGTLAAAYAEAGRFNDAVATATKAAELADAAGDTQFAAVNRQLLSLYRAGRPYHEMPTR